MSVYWHCQNEKILPGSIQRQRRWENNPTTLKDLDIPFKLEKILLGLRRKNFLAYDSGFHDIEAFLIFCTEQKLDVSDSTLRWHADVTLKCCSASVYHLYAVHGVLNGHTIPLVYMLLKLNTRKLYLRDLIELKEINLCVQPYQISIHLKTAYLLAFKHLFRKV